MPAIAQVVDKRQMTDRMVDLSIASPALNAKANVRLLLPPGWPDQPGRDWPVLYLLHGCCFRDTYAGWTNRTDVASLTSGTEVLVVMPEAGRAGYYSDWWNHGKGGAPAWETFHISELLPILRRDYRAGDALAIAGLSVGGLGAMAYAARHPDKFKAAASYSGDLHTLRAPWITQSVLLMQGKNPTAVWGRSRRHAGIWAAHNPYDLVPELLRIPLYVSSGNGMPGPLDPDRAPLNPRRWLPDPTEKLLYPQSVDFVERVRSLGGNVVTDFYGPGTHTWPYWERALHGSFDLLMGAIGAQSAPART